MSKSLVIINPTAGGGRAKALWPTLEPRLKEALGSFEIKVTKKRGEGQKIAGKTANFSRVIACGGDGTIHEVANGLFQIDERHRPVLGILSMGTGSDFIKSLKIPNDPFHQVATLKQGQTRKIDVGKIEFTLKGKQEKRIFLNIVDAGLGADVLERLHTSRRFFGRSAAYLLATLQAYRHRKCHEMEIVVDGERGWREKALLIALANGQCFGGGMRIAPHANLEDGLIDITLVRDLSPTRLPLVLPALYAGKLDHLPQVTMRRGRRVEINSSFPVPLDIDGEQIGTLPLHLEVLPEALRLFS
ncbi:MAG: diacylglycerol kinase family lipid kinase [Deltaproteobacteria bacterium]|nr:diacylglycerol kinase family lipid kinase [Deltaproteobacteria bacterium]